MKRRQTEGAADLVLTVPAARLTDVTCSGRRSRRSARPTRRNAVEWEYDDACLRPYDGHEKLLIRTALIRAKGYEKANHPLIASSRDVANLCKYLESADQEHMVVLATDAKMRVHGIFEAAVGGADSVAIDVKNVVKIPLLTGALSVIIVHNHPSGSSSPSQEDIAFTKHAKQALQCIGVTLLDHVIVARDGSFAFGDAGLL